MAGTVRKLDYGRIGIILLTLALAALCAAMLGLLIYRAGFRVPINGNEGWNALHADDAFSMLNFYEPDGFANFPNYPPLSFYIVGGLGRLIGDNVFAGRWIALISILILVVNMGLIAARIGATRANAVLAALVGLLFFLLLFPGYVMMNDPQWIGHAFQSTALVLLLAPGEAGRRTGTLVAVMALSLAGGLIKHNLAVVPLAITIWLAIHDRRALRTWLVSSALALALTGAVAYGLYGTSVFTQVLGHQRVYVFIDVLTGAWLLVKLAAPLLLAILGAAAFRHRTRAQLIILFAALSLVLGAFFDGGRSVSSNAYLDLLIAIMPLAALGIQSLQAKAPARSALTALPLMVLLFSTVPLLFGAKTAYGDSLRIAGKLKPTNQVLTQIAAADGPVSCENPTYCYWAGKKNSIDFSNTGQLLILNEADKQAFADLIASKKLALIQVNSASSWRIGKFGVKAIKADYKTIRKKPVYLYVPR